MGKHLYKEDLRRCCRCKRVLPLTKEYFYTNKSMPKGLGYNCCKCEREYQKNWRKKNQGKRSEYYKKNREEVLKHCHEYYLKNHTKLLKWRRERYKKNFNHIKIVNKKWKEKNRDYCRNYFRNWRRKWIFIHREQVLEYGREWRFKNKEKVSLYTMRRIARLKGAEGNYSLEEWENLKKKFDYRCAICGRKEPETKLTIDHIIPLSKEGSNYISNIQPLCKNCNSKKGVKI